MQSVTSRFLRRLIILLFATRDGVGGFTVLPSSCPLQHQVSTTANRQQQQQTLPLTTGHSWLPWCRIDSNKRSRGSTPGAICLSVMKAADLPTRDVTLLHGHQKKLVGKLQARVQNLDVRRFINRLGFTLWSNIDFMETFAIFIIAFGTVPLVKFLYNRVYQPKEGEFFRGSKVSAIAYFISELGQLGLLVYAFDLLYVLALAAGLPETNTHVPRQVAILVYTLYGAHVVKDSKKRYIRQRWGEIKTTPKSYILNTVCNAMISTVVGLVLFGDFIDALAENFHLNLDTFYRLFGIGGIFAGLGFQKTAREVSGGILLAFQNKFASGDTLLLSDRQGTGTVVKVGILQTTMLDSQGHESQVPNSVLLDPNVVNLSRCKHAQVSQTVNLRPSDVPEIESVLEAIKQEIKKSCPSVVTNGTMPLSVH